MCSADGAPFLSVLLGLYPFMQEPSGSVCIPWWLCFATLLLGITAETCGSCLNG